MSAEWDIFISFRNVPADVELADEVYESLRARGFSVFFSKYSVVGHGEAEFQRAISAGLESARILVLIGTDKANIESKWVLAEWSTFINEINSNRKPGGQLYLYTSKVAPGDLPIDLRRMQMFVAGAQGLSLLSDMVTNALAGGDTTVATSVRLTLPAETGTRVRRAESVELGPSLTNGRFALRLWCAVPDRRYDFEAAAFLLDAGHRVRDERDVAFFDQPGDAAGAVRYLGNDREGSWRSFHVDLNRLPQEVHRVAFVGFLYEPPSQLVHFGRTSGVVFQLQAGAESPANLCLASDQAQLPPATAIRVVDLHRDRRVSGKWHLLARLESITNGFAGVCELFDVP